jgi:WD40 repeat protein
MAAVLVLASWLTDNPASDRNNLVGSSSGKITTLAFSPDGQTLASAGYYSPIAIWEMTHKTAEMALQNSPETVPSLSFSPDGAILAAADLDGNVRIWNTGSWSLAHVLRADADGVRHLAFSPDGKLLATVGQDRTIRLWHTAAWELGSVLEANDSSVRCVAFSSDGQELAAASLCGTVTLWDLKSGASDLIAKPAPGERARLSASLAFSPNNASLAMLGGDTRLLIWDLYFRKPKIHMSESQNVLLGLTFSPDGKTLAAGTKAGFIERWNVETGERLPELRGHSAPVWALAFSPDGRSLVSGGYDGALRLWDAKPQ